MQARHERDHQGNGAHRTLDRMGAEEFQTGACPLGTVARLAAMHNIAGHRAISSIETAWRFEGEPAATIYISKY